jgi:hypothetical protein
MNPNKGTEGCGTECEVESVQVYLFSSCEITFTKVLAAQIFTAQHF